MGKIIDRGLVLVSLGIETTATNAEKTIVEEAIRHAEAAVKRHLRYDPVLRTRTEFYPVTDRSRSARETVWEASESVAYERNVSEAATSELQLRHIPIRATASVELWIDYDGRFGARSGSFGSESKKVEGEDFWANYESRDDDGYGVCEDGILRSIGLWPVEPGSVKVQYPAGYSADELSGSKDKVNATGIYEACLNEALRRAKKVFVNKKSKQAGFVAGPMSNESLGSYSYSIDTATASKLFGVTSGVMSETKDILSEFVHYGLEV